MTVSAPLRSLGIFIALAGAIAPTAAGCRSQEPPAPPVAAPSIRINHDKAPLGSPIEITYKFVVQNTAAIDQDYRVMVHVVDTDGELMWTYDHDPSVPTTQWKQGQEIEYTKTEFVPIYPYVGEATIELGLYSTSNQKRLPLAGEDAGKLSYKMGRLQLAPQTENVFTVFKDGWYPAEVAEHNASVEWQWTKKQATLSFKNPKKDSMFYLALLDNPGTMLKEPQQVQVSLGGQPVDRFTLGPKQELLRKIPLPAARLGSVDIAELEISVDKTFVPALLDPNSKDPRELGVRVLHAFVDAR
jgi:hypothetical protein